MATHTPTPPRRGGERPFASDAHPHDGLDLTAVAIALCGIGSWLLPAVGYVAGWL